MRRFGDWVFEHIESLLISLTVGLCVLVCILVVFALRDDAEKLEYIQANGCEKTGETHSSTTVICNRIGDSTICNPVTTKSSEYACNNGERVWR